MLAGLERCLFGMNESVSMSIEDVIDFLGRDVNFIYRPKIIFSEDLYILVSGIVEKVVICEDLTECEILVNGEYFMMASVDFIEILKNPAQL